MRWLLLALILVMFYGGGICCSDEEAKWELEQMMKVSILSKNYVCYSLDLKLCTEYLNYCIDFVFCILYFVFECIFEKYWKGSGSGSGSRFSL